MNRKQSWMIVCVFFYGWGLLWLTVVCRWSSSTLITPLLQQVVTSSSLVYTSLFIGIMQPDYSSLQKLWTLSTGATQTHTQRKFFKDKDQKEYTQLSATQSSPSGKYLVKGSNPRPVTASLGKTPKPTLLQLWRSNHLRRLDCSSQWTCVVTFRRKNTHFRA